MKWMFLFVVLMTAAIGGYAVYSIRTAQHDPSVWHLDPLEALPTGKENSYRVAPSGLTEYTIDQVSPIYAANAATLAKAFDDFVMGQPRVTRLDGSAEAGWITYVQKTETLQAPDYISVRFYDLDGENLGKATIAVYSRSRFGHGDMGVNEARVKAWLTSISSFEE